MKIVIPNPSITAFILAYCTCSLSAQTVTPDLKAVPEGKGWKGNIAATKLTEKDGASAIELNGLVWLDGFEFQSGTIEFDAQGKSAPPQSSFVGVAFRVVDAETHDAVYFRPFNFHAADPARRLNAVQYHSLPQWKWDKLRKEKPGQFEKPIEFPPDGDAWFHAKVVVENQQVRVFVNGAAEASLVVNELSERPGGSLGLWSGGYGVIANLKITPATAQKAVFKDDFIDKSPHKSAFINVNGVKLHYLDWGGKGNPLLFLTGLGHSAHIYDDLAPKFVDEFRALALTWRGHGKSDRPETGYDVDTLTEDVRQFLDAMKIERVTLVGYSMAGEELTRFAGLYPERVDRLVYLDAAYDRTDPGFRASRSKASDVFALLNSTPQDSSKKPRNARTEAQEADSRETVFHSSEGKLEYVTSGKIIGLLAQGYRRPDYAKVKAPALSFFAVPTMESGFPWITPGVKAEVRKQAQDLLETDMLPRQRRQIEEFRKGVENARVIEMPNTRHDCFIDKQEEVVREMRAFLAGR